MVTTEDLQARIEDLISGRLALPGFSEWLAEATWDDSQLETTVRTLVGSVELIIAEYTGGAWSWDEARALLREVSEHVELVGIELTRDVVIRVRANGLEQDLGGLPVADAASLASSTR